MLTCRQVVERRDVDGVVIVILGISKLMAGWLDLTEMEFCSYFVLDCNAGPEGPCHATHPQA